MTPPANPAVKVQRAYAAGSHGQIHFRRAGATRSPLLLLHSFPGTGSVFENFMAEIGRDHATIAPDLPGFGMSDSPTAAPTIADYAEAMLQLEAELGLGVIDVLGYHAGGAIALEMARQQPNVVRKIVMISAPLFTDQEKLGLKAKHGSQPPDTLADALAQNWTAFKAAFYTMGSDIVPKWDIFLESQKDPMKSSWGIDAVFNYDLSHALSGVTQPILLLNPDDDLKAQTQRAAALIKNGRMHALPGWSYGFLDAKTTETAALVRDFLDH